MVSMKRSYYRIMIIFVLVLFGTVFLNYQDATTKALTRLKVQSMTLDDEAIPSSFNGLRLVYFTDLHAFNHQDDGFLDSIFQAISVSDADFIIFGGDLIDGPVLKSLSEEQKQKMITWLKSLDAPLGKFAVLGEDDMLEPDLIKDIYTQGNFEILDNSSVLLRNHTDEGVLLVGHNPYLSSFDNTVYANQDASRYTLSVAYNPEVVLNLSENDTSLMLSGMTHGGQVYLPVFGSTYSKGNGPYRKGEYTVNGIDLWVSGGLGTVETQARWLNDPSFILITFKKP